MLGWRKRLAVAIGAVVVVAGGLLATTVLAETPTPTATPGGPGSQQQTQRPNYRQVFLGKLATALNLDQATLESKIKQAEKDTIDQAVADGNLASNAATAAKQRIDQAPAGALGGPRGFGFPFGIGRGMRGGMGDHGRRGPAANHARVDLQQVQQAIADKLGIKLADLQAALKSGKSLSDLAQASNVSLADVQAAAVAAVKAQLDPLVANKQITQAQEDAIVARYQSGQLPGFGPKGMLGPGARPAPTATPSGSSS